jgi:hypothetical protein
LRKHAHAAALLGILLVAAWLRIRAADGRELWNDDVGRLRLAMLSWDGVFARLPYLDNLKSPYLVGLHKVWTDLFGTASILAIRGWSIAWGLATVALVHGLVGSVAGRRMALAAAAWFAVNPFFVRWSVEVHQYAPAAAALLGAAWVVLGREELTVKSVVAFGALAGLGVALFPGVAPAFLVLAFAPSVRRLRDKSAWIAALVAAFAIAAPAAISLAASAACFKPAAEADRVWSPFFSPMRTPWEILARTGGLDIRQGTAPRWILLAAGVVLAAAVAFALRRDEKRPVRLTLLAAGLIPMAILCVASMRGIGVCNDRYVHAAAALLPVGVLVAFAPSGPGRRAACVATAVLWIAVGFGVVTMFRHGDRFPRDLTSRSYACAALVDAELADGARPDVLLVHGDVQFSQVWIRSRARAEGVGDLRHLSTAAWARVERDGDLRETCVPPAYGWPFNAAELAGGPVTVSIEDAAREVAAGRRVWVVLENPAIVRQYHLEEDERTSGLDEAFRRLAAPQSPARREAIAAALKQCLGVAEDAPVRTRFAERAVLVAFGAR